MNFTYCQPSPLPSALTLHLTGLSVWMQITLSLFAGWPALSIPRYLSVKTFWITHKSSCLINLHYVVSILEREGGLRSHCGSYPLVVLSITRVTGNGLEVGEDEV